MGSKIFGDLGSAFGGLVDGLSKTGLIPKDDPAVKLLSAQKDVSELKKQEDSIFAAIGRQAFDAAPDAYGQRDKLRLIQANISEAEEKVKVLQQELDEAKRAEEEERKAKEAAESATRCPSCGNQNPEGTHFCQECGTKLGVVQAARVFCTSCGAELQFGARFCGGCGAKQDG